MGADTKNAKPWYKQLAVVVLVVIGLFLIWSVVNQWNRSTMADLDQIAEKSDDSWSEVKELHKRYEEGQKAEANGPEEWADGTYEVGVDIPAGVYQAEGTDCYWRISRDSNGSDIIENDYGDGQHIVTIEKGTFFKVSGCVFTSRES